MLGALKFKLDHMTRPRPFQGRFVICRLERAAVNRHTKFDVSTITCYEDMEGNAKCRNCGDLGSLKVIGNSTEHIRLSSRLRLSSTVFKLQRAIFWKSPISTYPTFILRLRWESVRLSFAEILGVRKVYPWFIVRRSLRDPAFRLFSRTPTCDRQTDRQTHDYGIYRASVASRGRNENLYSPDWNPVAKERKNLTNLTTKTCKVCITCE